MKMNGPQYKTDILFINKKRHTYGDNVNVWNPNSPVISSGLANSVSMINIMLNSAGKESVLEEAIDNNCIDRLVTLHRPRTVVIEALWVVPEKFEILHRLHPEVNWVVRLHSEIPFLSNEGSAFQWMNAYAKQAPVVTIAANSIRLYNILREHFKVKILHLPNYYVCDNNIARKRSLKDEINISCFGAIRPLKNVLIQAVAAIKYANKYKYTLNFHVNSTRIEGNAGSTLKNLRSLFDSTKHSLIEHVWHEHEDFKTLIREKIDIGLQVSFSESYNIVAADHVDCGVPIVTSSEVDFVSSAFYADPSDVDDIVKSITCAMRSRIFGIHHINNYYLRRENREAWCKWIRFIESSVDC